MKLSLGFSSCPNDTFIFDAMVHKKVDTEGLDFKIFIEDVEELNLKALEGALDITKLSFHALGHCARTYNLLASGSALGRGCGPLLVAKKSLNTKDINSGKVAIPGRYTTANLLFKLAYPNAERTQEYLFSDIEQKVLKDEVDAGLVIHENRFTYKSLGLVKVLDCGEYWEKEYKRAIPLGGIAVLKKLSFGVQKKVKRVLDRSISYAFEKPEETLGFVKSHAMAMDLKVMRKHIELYVNPYTKDLGKEGKEAVKTLYDIGVNKGILPKNAGSIVIVE